MAANPPKPLIFIVNPWTAGMVWFGVRWRDGSESMFYESIADAMRAIEHVRVNELARLIMRSAEWQRENTKMEDWQ